MLATVLSGILPILAISAIAALIIRRPAAVLSDTTGEIIPNKTIFILVTLFMGGLTTWALYEFAIYMQPLILIGAALALFGVAIGVSMITPWYKLEWNATSITGPSTSIPYPYGPRRQTIKWDDVVYSGMDNAGNHVLRTEKGDRVLWHLFYNGNRDLLEYAKKRRPDLEHTHSS